MPVASGNASLSVNARRKKAPPRTTIVRPTSAGRPTIHSIGGRLDTCRLHATFGTGVKRPRFGGLLRPKRAERRLQPAEPHFELEDTLGLSFEFVSELRVPCSTVPITPRRGGTPPFLNQRPRQRKRVGQRTVAIPVAEQPRRFVREQRRDREAACTLSPTTRSSISSFREAVGARAVLREERSRIFRDASGGLVQRPSGAPRKRATARTRLRVAGASTAGEQAVDLFWRWRAIVPGAAYSSPSWHSRHTVERGRGSCAA